MCAPNVTMMNSYDLENSSLTKYDKPSALLYFNCHININ